MERIGAYKVIGVLGKGGMGKVYLAEDERLNRKVALKLLHTSFENDPNREQRFLNEARTMANLNHANITTLYDLVKVDDGYVMVMEYVRGVTMNEWSKQVGKNYDAYFPMLMASLSALSYAHKRNIIHRDIKPQNIMVDEGGEVKVMDFGIARVQGSDRMTKVGSIVGTLEYISPEQLQGQEADQRSDLYSLGLAIYECILGRHPYADSTEIQLIHKQQNESLPPLPDVPKPFQEFLRKLTHKNPSKRFQSADKALEALENLRLKPTGTSVPAPFLGLSGFMSRIVGISTVMSLRRQLPYILLGLGIVGVIAALAVTLLDNNKSLQRDPAAVVEKEESRKARGMPPVDRPEWSNEGGNEALVNILIADFHRYVEEESYFGAGKSAMATLNQIIKLTSNGSVVENLRKELIQAVKETLERYCRNKEERKFETLKSNAVEAIQGSNWNLTYDRDCAPGRQETPTAGREVDKGDDVARKNRKDDEAKEEDLEEELPEEEASEDRSAVMEKGDEKPKEPAKASRSVTIPSGTAVIGELKETISSASVRTGQTIRMPIGRDIAVGGQSIPAGAGYIEARVTLATSTNSGKRARLELELTTIHFGDQSIPLRDARISQNGSRREEVVLDRGTQIKAYTDFSRKINY